MSTLALSSMESLYYDTQARLTAEDLGKLLLAVNGLALNLQNILPSIIGFDGKIAVNSFAAPITVGSPLDLKFLLEIATRTGPDGKKLHDGILSMLGLRKLTKTNAKLASFIVVAFLVGGGWALNHGFGSMSGSEREDRKEAIRLELHNSTMMIGSELNTSPDNVQHLIQQVSKKHGRQLANTAVKLAQPGRLDSDLTIKVGGVFPISKTAVQAVPKEVHPTSVDQVTRESLSAEPCLMIRMNRADGVKGWVVELKRLSLRLPAEIADGIDLSSLIRRDEVILDVTLEKEWVEHRGEYKPKKAYITGVAD